MTVKNGGLSSFAICHCSCGSPIKDTKKLLNQKMLLIYDFVVNKIFKGFDILPSVWLLYIVQWPKRVTLYLFTFMFMPLYYNLLT